MKDLKENIKKNNMKKLVLSAALGMFCYCTNNAMKKPENPKGIKNIDYVLKIMLLQQSYILKFKAKIENVKGKIYSKIKEQDETVKKGRVLEFIKNQFTNKEPKQKGFDDDIKKIEQYFHLEGKNDDYECTKYNLTEIFWGDVEDKKEILEEEEKKIGYYFNQIMYAEKTINKAFIEYYDAKKKENVTVQEGDILGKIMQECCGKETGDDLQKKFLANLENLCEKDENLKGNKDAILATIKRRRREKK